VLRQGGTPELGRSTSRELGAVRSYTYCVVWHEARGVVRIRIAVDMDQGQQ
jgi:hypothetical protein